jgi:hypothetical protein
MRRALAVALVAVLAAPVSAATPGKSKRVKAQAGSRIEGRVVNTDEKPVSGAVVSVRSLDGDATWTSPPSDAKGRFELSGIPYGWADLVVSTAEGEFLGDQAINLPPGTKVVMNFTLLETADKPASWWADRRVEAPNGLTLDQVAGMAQSSQRLTGVEYWKTPAGIAILASAGVVVLAVIAAGGRNYTAP